MADGIVSVFLEKLYHLMVKEPLFLLGVEHQLILFRDELEWIRSFLSEAQQRRRESRLVEVWVTQIIDLSYEAEDVIDAYILHKEQQRGRQLIQKMMHLGQKVKMLHQLGNRIEQINTRAQRISACRLNYDLGVSKSAQESESEMAEYVAYRRRGVSTFNESDIVGLKEERSRLTGQLIDGEAFPSRKVISILGMGGLGKTTLARVIFNDVSNHFQARIWLTVSEKYNAGDLLLSAQKQLVGEAKMDYKQMEEEVLKNLVSKRYLVVIDDIWNVEDWERISLAFPNNDTGSRIMLTTRNREVALHAVASREHHLELRLLDKDERWELFRRKVFSGGACPEHLVEVGGEIVEKCGGLPLAIVVIGGLVMGRERTASAWSKVRDSAKWQFSQDSNLCRETLKLSYDHLPHYLKSCFLYLGLFPEDYEIEADRLILLWVAEGFVPPRGEANMEDVAEDYLEELIQRSMILVTKRKYLEGPVLACRIHDLLRDLAVSESRRDKFMDFHTSKNRYSPSTRAKLRRFANHSTTSDEYEDQCCHTVTTSNPNMRTLFLFASADHYHGVLKSISFNGIKMLRVLDMFAGWAGTTVPKEIGSLSFLHYLRLQGLRRKTLPNSIGKLFNLQTLHIPPLFNFPRTIWKLQNLRHLHIGRHCKMSRHVGKLCRRNAFGSNLLTLKLGHEAWMRISDVVVNVGCLQSLNVSNSIFNGPIQNYFPLGLTDLTLWYSNHVEDPSGVLGSLPKLMSLVLDHISIMNQEGEMAFIRQGFSQLESLKLYYLGRIQWRVEDGALPSLRDLAIIDSENLEKLPGGLKTVYSLQRIRISRMPQAFYNRVKENGQDWEIIKHVPIIDIDENEK